MLLHENSHGVKMIHEDKVKRSAVNKTLKKSIKR